MEYKEYAKENELFTNCITTVISSKVRISSVYRKYSNPNFELWGWETLLLNDGKIEEMYDVIYEADKVLNLHADIFKNYSNK